MATKFTLSGVKYPYGCEGIVMLPGVPLDVPDSDALVRFLDNPGVKARMAKGQIKVETVKGALEALKK